jgi:FMN phosphatase YigB (HAD superfamily)
VAEIDMVAWDFGDTLVDEQLMRIPPPEVPEWTDAINRLWDADGWAERWELGEVSMNELVLPLAERLPMSPIQVARYLRATWRSPRMLEPAASWLYRLRDVVTQVIVTVNPHEFHGVAAATGLDSHVDLIVTSADVRSTSKVVQARQARRWLGLDEDLTSTLLIDNKATNTAEFCEHGGQAVLFAENEAPLDEFFLPLVR